MPRVGDDWIIIGVSGVTCGGKTTLANKLKDSLVPIYVFHQDKYFYPDDSPHHIRCVDLDHNNYDILSSLDMDLMYKDIMDTIQGTDKSHTSNVERVPGKYEVKNKKFLIIEGFTVMNFKPILEICNLRYYFVLSYEDCAARRCYRLYDPPDIEGYFDRCVWPEHLKYRAEIEKDKRVTILDGMQPNALEIVLADIVSKGGEIIK
ncbi:nicotinamide riboside kinase 2 isoform X1 [Epargyreus clarus]|uniref:nicotinamide riboside kinase 2 isoform X1 n=1 Tax=Epargyreus clarus TaxID=520877 RepID=UPI003C2EE83E